MKKSKSTFKLNKQKVASLEAKTIKGGTGTIIENPKSELQLCLPTGNHTGCYVCPVGGGGNTIIR